MAKPPTPPKKLPVVDPLITTLDNLAEVMARYGLSELEVDRKDLKVRLRRGGGDNAAPPVHAAAPRVVAPASTPAEDASLATVTSPFVGTFYRSAKPGAPPFVEVGQVVRRGQTLCIVEAMKLMNELESEIDGTVVEILARDAQPVEYGQVLFRVRP